MRGKLYALAAGFIIAVFGAAPAQAQLEPSAAQCEAAWAAVLADENAVTLEQFISALPTCPQTDEARQHLIALTSSAQPAPPVAAEEVRPSRGLSDSHFGAPGEFVYVPAGRLLARGMPMTPEGGGYGVLLFRRGGAQNVAACEVFVRALGFTNERTDGWVEQVDSTYVYRRPIYWLTRQSVSATQPSDCPAMVAAYDYERAAIMLARLNASEEGPILAIWRADGSAAGVFDYSRMSRAELSRQFSASLFHLSQSEEIWEPGFYQPASLQQRILDLSPAQVLNTTTALAARLIMFVAPTVTLQR